MREFIKKIDAPAVVAGAAFIASAGHIVSVVDETNPIVFALAYPIGIDGLLYVGMKAMKERRFKVGTVALVVGTFFSLAFNFHAEGAVQIPKYIIAASMPICLLAAFIIEHIGRKVETPAPAPVVAPVPVTASVIRWVSAGARWTLPIVPMSAPEPIKVESTVRRRKVEGRTNAPALTDGRTVRPAAWDVEKAVRLIQDGRTNAEVAPEAGTNDKAIQRTRRAVKLITSDASLTDENVADMMNRDVSPAHVARIRVAMNERINA